MGNLLELLIFPNLLIYLRYFNGILLDSQTIYHNSIPPSFSEMKRREAQAWWTLKHQGFGPEIHTQFPWGISLGEREFYLKQHEPELSARFLKDYCLSLVLLWCLRSGWARILTQISGIHVFPLIICKQWIWNRKLCSVFWLTELPYICSLMLKLDGSISTQNIKSFFYN